MSSFAQKLKYYVEKSGQTIYSVSVTSGVERTMVHKMIKGDRIPTNKDIVLAIARTLLLSPSDTDELVTAYEISLRGESAYHQLQYVQKLLLNCAKPSLLKIDSTPRKLVLKIFRVYFPSRKSHRRLSPRGLMSTSWSAPCWSWSCKSQTAMFI